MKHRAAEFGFKIDGAGYDWGKIIKRSREVSDKGAAGIEFLFKKNKIDYLRGEGTAGQGRRGEGEERGRQGRDAHGAEDPHRHRLRRRGRCRACPSTARR